MIDSLKIERNPEGEEVPVKLTVEKVGSFDINIFISGKELYLPIGEIFTLLKVNYKFSENNLYVSGFFAEEKNIYHISVKNNIASVSGITFKTKRDDFYVTENDIFIREKLFYSLFEFTGDFDTKQLKLYLISKTKLPIILEEERRLFRLKFEKNVLNSKADALIERKRKVLSGGFIDWSLNYNHNPYSDNLYYNLSIGSEILGGDVTANFTGNKDTYIDFNGSGFRWRFVDDKKFFQQAVIGDLNLTSGLFYDVKGIQITNSPPALRTLQGSYKIFDNTFPNWEVELYLNNDLFAFTRADNTGYFEFDVPLVYGSNFIKIKFYGPSGEEKVMERVIQSPYSFLPPGKFEYYLSGGKLRYGDEDEVAEGTLNWGISNRLTVGTSLSYINRDIKGRFYPGLNVSYKIFNNLILSSSFIQNNKGRISANLLLPSQISADFSYIRYASNPFFNPLNYYEEKNYNIFVPFNIYGLNVSLRTNLRDVMGLSSKSYLLSSGLFLSFNNIQASINSNGNWVRNNDKLDVQTFFSSISFSSRIFWNTYLRFQTDLNHVSGKLNFMSVNIDRSLFENGWLSLNAGKDYIQDSYFAGLTFRYDFPFLRSNSDAYFNNDGFSFQQSFYGSVGFDDYKKKFILDNQFNSSKCGISIVPFIDLNGNSKKDDNESILYSLLDVTLESGKKIVSFETKNIWFLDLEPYTHYLLEINPSGLENPLLKPKFKNLLIFTDPARIKTVFIPVYVSNIVSGKITYINEGIVNPAPKIPVTIVNEDGLFSRITNTFSDGEFLFDDVPSGKYKIFINKNNIKSYISNKEYIIIEITPSEEGDIIDNIDFILYPKEK